MKQKKDLIYELMFTKDLKSLVGVYEQLSAMRLQAIRDRVLQTRNFSTNVSSVVSDIRMSYRKQLEDLQRQGKLKQLVNLYLSQKSKKWSSVLVSPNQRLTGQIVPRMFELFLQEVKSISSDIVIIGKVGKDIYEQMDFKRPFTYFDLPAEHPTIDDLKPLIIHLLQYSKVDIYHSKFNSLVSQEVVKSDITGEKLLFSSGPEKGADTSNGKFLSRRDFLFEPKIREILIFLEAQLLALFLKQAIHESDLANLGSRVTSLESATIHIDKVINKLEYQKRVQTRVIRNSKQRQMLSGMRLWGAR